MSEQVETTQPAAGTAGDQQAQQPPKTETVEELKAQIARLEAAVKDANKEEAKRRKRLEELEKAEQERQAAQMSETDKLQKKLAELERRAAEMAAENQRIMVRNAIELAAAEMGFHKPAEAYALADLSTVTVDGDQVKGVKEALEALAKSSPHLLKSQQQAAPVPPTPRPDKGHPAAVEDIAARKRAEYAGTI